MAFAPDGLFRTTRRSPTCTVFAVVGLNVYISCNPATALPIPDCAIELSIMSRAKEGVVVVPKPINPFWLTPPTNSVGVVLPLLAIVNAGFVVSSSRESVPQGEVVPIPILFETTNLDVEAVPVMAKIEVVALVEKRLVEEAVVAKKLVEVELVVVELIPVKLSKVVEPERRRLESEVSPAVAVRVPVKLAALEIV